MGRILVVHGSREVQTMLCVELRRACHDVIVAHNGEQALEAYGEQKPDLAIIDQRLPDMDGLFLVRLLRAIDPAVEAIVLTERATTEELREARRLGVTAVLRGLFSNVSVH